MNVMQLPKGFKKPCNDPLCRDCDQARADLRSWAIKKVRQEKRRRLIK